MLSTQGYLMCMHSGKFISFFESQYLPMSLYANNILIDLMQQASQAPENKYVFWRIRVFAVNNSKLTIQKRGLCS